MCVAAGSALHCLIGVRLVNFIIGPCGDMHAVIRTTKHERAHVSGSYPNLEKQSLILNKSECECALGLGHGYRQGRLRNTTLLSNVFAIAP